MRQPFLSGEQVGSPLDTFHWRDLQFDTRFCFAAVFIVVLALFSGGVTPARTAAWTLLWSDEFNGPAGTGVNPINWLYDTGTGYGCPGCPPNWGTGEVETMSSSTANVAQDGAGHLALTPLRDAQGNWTSGRIETQRTDFAAPPGGVLAVEASIQQPNVSNAAAAGYWPAFWMLGTPFRGNYLNWPGIGEIDVMEDVNGRSAEFANLHCGTNPGGPCNEPSGISSGQLMCPGCQAAFHTYRMEYDRSVSPEQLRWYLDGANIFTVNATQVDATTWDNALHHGFFLLLDVAMGGGFPAAFGGGPTASTASGAPLLVDYVRVYSASGSVPGTLQINPTAVSLTTTPGVSPSPQTLLLTNTGTIPLNWSVASLPSWVNVSPTSGNLPGNGIQPLTLTFNTPSPTPQTYTTNLVLTDPNAANSPFSVPITVVSANVSTTWYFAEGFTGGSFTEFLTLANPTVVPATVQVQYFLGTGQVITRNYLVNPASRFTVKVNNEIGPNQNVSVVVTSTVPIIAERPIYFTYTGLLNSTIPGGTDVLGATQLGTSFDFGYLDTSNGHDTFLTILNQNNVAMNVTIQYFPASGGAPILRPHQAPPNSRFTVKVNNEGLPAGSYSALVTLDQPGLVERPLYLVDSITHFTGSADVVGVTTPLTGWDFAEGYTLAGQFSERYLLSNPTSNVAHATVTFFLTGGGTQTASVTINPGAQQVVDANAVLGSNSSNSAHVQADQPILAERFMSFDFRGSVPGATDVLGAAQPSNLFLFSEGFTGPGFFEFLTIENPDPTNTAYVQVTFLPANGGNPVVRIYQVASSSRFTLDTSTVMPGQSFSMIVESNVAIVAERPMYFTFPPTQTGGSDVVGYQP